jgi:flavin reductase (DIM6/NTAB) family NADH-FMN oxidoreductase RutF
MVGREPITHRDPVALTVEGGAFWDQVFVPAPLVLVATLDEDGAPDLAPKHQALPLGWQGWFGFACTSRHHTHGNARRTGCFTVSYPVASQVVEIGQSAAPRVDGTKAGLALLPTRPATVVKGVVVTDAALWLECELERVVEGFGEHDLLVGRVVHAAAPRWAVRDDDVDDADLVHDHPMLVYLCPSRFAAVQESWSFPFPAEFRR